jgi:hypothetical protein
MLETKTEPRKCPVCVLKEREEKERQQKGPKQTNGGPEYPFLKGYDFA